jgi:cobalt-zinc-cadmium efflux system protein
VIVLIMNLVLIAVLAVVGVQAHSLGVLAAGVDYLADAGAILIALLANWLGRRPPTPRRPEGYPRATAYAALVNAVLLGIIVSAVIAVATWRLVTGSIPVHGVPVVIASVAAAAVMAVGALVLLGDTGDAQDSDADRANMRAVLLDTVADAFAAAGVAAAGIVIALTGSWYWLDPAIALLIAVVIGYHVLVLLVGVVSGLRSGVPTPAPD